MIHREDQIVPFVAPDIEILLVDDIETNLMVAKGLLAPFQFKISTCKSGFEALEVAKTKRFDIMLIDHMMPKMDGVETLKRLRENQYGQKGVPAIAFTANAIVGTKDMLLSKGFDDFISKPIDSEGLLRLLEKWVPLDKQKEPPKDLETKNDDGLKECDRVELPEIEGVDTQAGFRRSGGTVSKYLALLKVFMLDALAAISNLDKEIKGELNLDELSIIFHGMKSASGNIGAKTFSSEALKLEKKAKSVDRSYVNRERIEIFRDNLNNLVLAIQEGMNSYSKTHLHKIYIKGEGLLKAEAENGEARDFLEREPKVVHELKEALEQKDVGKADRLLEELEGKSSIDKRRLFQEVSDLVLISDFQGALQIINNMDKETNYGITNN
jgi:CheY-like chemotaxis protein